MTENETPAMPLKEGYKKLCLRLGLMIIVVFSSRGICSVLLSLLKPSISGLSVTAAYLIQTAFSLVFLYAIPIAATVLLLKIPVKKMSADIYKKPKYFGSALGMFPAFYSLAIIANLLTMWITSLVKTTDFNDSFNTVNELTAPNTASGVILFVQMAILAPLIEEFWFRGMVLESLRPYGNGVAIFISAFLFGLTHANFAQFFYATIFGVFLGYIAVSTRSVVTTTVIHAIFNSFSASILLLLTNKSVADFIILTQSGQTGEMTPAVVIYIIICGIMLLTAGVGLIMACFKIAKIKKYKVPVVQTELSAKKRWAIFFSAFTVIIGLCLAADSFTARLIPTKIYQLISTIWR